MMCIFAPLAIRHGRCQAPGVPITRKVSCVMFPLLIYTQRRASWKTEVLWGHFYSCSISPVFSVVEALISLLWLFLTSKLLSNIHENTPSHLPTHTQLFRAAASGMFLKVFPCANAALPSVSKLPNNKYRVYYALCVLPTQWVFNKYYWLSDTSPSFPLCLWHLCFLSEMIFLKWQYFPTLYL